MSRSSIDRKVVEALSVTAEICGTVWSEAAAAAVLAKLAPYQTDTVLAALDRCQTELTGRLTLAAIIERIDDGRPTADEAWAQVGTTDERRTLVSTDEAFLAFGEVSALMQTDEVGARMAFRDAYKRIVTANRAAGVPVDWRPSLGFDREGRDVAIAEAMAKGRLDAGYVERVLGYLPAGQAPATAKRLPPGDPKRIAAERQERNLQGLADLKAALANAKTLDTRQPYKSIDWQAEEARLNALPDMGEQPFELGADTCGEDKL